MAFDNKGADWLSASNEIVNPYMPKQMIDCGSNKDSVDFRPRK
jgi:Cu(I)/Ag(I) efflux system membrane fusion protein